MVNEKEIEEFNEMMCYFFINEIGGILWRTNHDAAHGRYEITPEMFADLTELSNQQQFCVKQLIKFGVDPESANNRPDGDYWKWFRHWDEWKNKMSDDEWYEFDKKLTNKEDVTEYLREYLERKLNKMENIEEKELELRMYFFVPFNVSDIYKGIQAGHSALEYARMFGQDKEFIDFVTLYKTWIILNGGTTNDERELVDFDYNKAVGTLNQIADSLYDNDIKFTVFREPDLNNSLTAICFIVDERVFNKKDYPDFIDYITNIKMYPEALTMIYFENREIFKKKSNAELQLLFPEYYKEWIRFIGGIKNEFLRDLIKDKRLA